VPGLRVTARTSSFAFKGKEVDLREIGSKLHVAHVLEGSVRKSGDRVRITAQLIDARSGYHIFSDIHDCVIGDIFETQDEIALKITRKLRASFPEEDGVEVGTRTRTDDPQAYSNYLRGRFFLGQWRSLAAERAAQYFKLAIESDPTFPQAHGGLAFAYMFMVATGQMDRETGADLARRTVERALELDPTGIEANLAMADLLLFIDWDFERAREAFEKAVAANPGFAQVYHERALVMRILGRIDDAIRDLQRAVELDPLSLPYNNALANALTAAGRYEEAEAQSDRTLEIDPAFQAGVEGRGWLLLHQGDLEGAIERFTAVRALNPRRDKSVGALGFAYGLAGRLEEARECLELLRSWHDADRGGSITFEIALVHAGLGEVDEACRYLRNAFEKRDPGILFLNTSVRGWGSAREASCFRAIVDEIGLEAFERA